MDRPLLLDSYAAKTCPYALHLDRVALVGDRLDFPDAVIERINAGIDFERRIGELVGAFPDVTALPYGRDRDQDPEGWAIDRAVRLAGTRAAMEAGGRWLWNPRLDPDLHGHRSGEPDILVRAGARGPRARYLPVDVKAHHALLPSFRERGTSLSADVGDVELLGVGSTGHGEDLLQLAHYWRMLEALDRVPDGPPRGAIIGWSGSVEDPPLVGWFALDTVLEEYDRAFAHAVAVVVRAEEVAAGSEVPPLGLPWYSDSCPECPWRGVCGPEMVATRHVSLVRPHARLRPHLEALGVATFDALAALEAGALRPDGLVVPATQPWRRAIQAARLARAGEPVPFAHVPEVGGDPYVRPWLWRVSRGAPWGLTRRDVELDVDMESAEHGAYLWGTLLTYPAGAEPLPGFDPGYRGFGDRFDEPGPAVTVAVFLEYLDFVERLKQAADAAGRSLGLYCYSGPSAEEPAMRRAAALAERAGVGPSAAARVEALLGAPEWVDLLVELRERVVSLSGLGLKVAAKALGFDWRADDAGGLASMRWYVEATSAPDPSIRVAMAEKILQYNEDDVAATRYLREWFSTNEPEALAVAP